MTDQQHPITPPPELVQEWLGTYFGATVNGELSESEKYLATQAARWGADQELEACCEWFSKTSGGIPSSQLRATRRPKPPSLKEQALAALDDERADMSLVNYKTIRAVLEQIDD